VPPNVELPGSLGMSAARLERIQPVMQSYVDEQGYGGIATLVSRRGKLVHAGLVGWQDREATVPLADDTIYRIYSMTKPIIYTALMTLYEEGRFQLVDPVAKYIPDFAATKVMNADAVLEDQNPLRPMQVCDLMTHSSGLTYDFLEESPVAAYYREARLLNDPTRPLEAMIAELAKVPLAFHPGAMWQYSLGTDVLMHQNHLPAHRLPYRLGAVPMLGWGFGLGSRVAMDVGQIGMPGSVGEFGWAGAAKTYYWVDPREELVGVLMTQFMVGLTTPEADFRVLVYQAIDD
jgi:CubicO group peptidase (beta-lactamase class C family)